MSLMNMREYHFGEFQLKLRSRSLERDGVPVPLGSKAFELLAYLAMHPGEVVTKEALLKAAWPDSYVEEKKPRATDCVAAQGASGQIGLYRDDSRTRLSIYGLGP